MNQMYNNSKTTAGLIFLTVVFTLLSGQVRTLADGEFIYAESDLYVEIPADGSWYGSGIRIEDAPVDATVTSIDVHYEIESSWVGYVYAELSDQYDSVTYGLVNGVNGSISQTRTGITAFNGKPVNQTWILWAREEYSIGGGYIDSWWIKLYYDAGPPSYCNASGGSSYEYISRVEVGTIDNSSGDDGYYDYTEISTSMEIGTGYTITVVNGYPYTSDECGIWVDWNQDMNFGDAGETITVSENPGTGPYTATITPPADANLGDTRMRIRIIDSDYDSLSPCGTTSYGEVEDYTINVVGGTQSITISGHATLSNGVPVEDVLVAVETDGSSEDITDTTDADGYYEIQVQSPWSGFVSWSKDKYYFNWPTHYSDVTEDLVVNISAFYEFSGGLGTHNFPYLISTPEDMNEIGNHPETRDKYFVLTNDIDLTGTTYSSAIIPSFSGQFDGAGFSVLNLQSNSGLFGNIKDAVIKNLGVVNVEITNAGIAGPLCRSNYGGTIENCFSTGNISGFYDIGGLCAWVHKEYIGEQQFGDPLPPVNTPVIKNCYSTVNVTLIHPDSLPEFSTGSAGGLCAYAEGAELFNNYACGSVDATGCDTPFGFDIVIDNGGLVGHIKNCNVYNNYSSGYVVDGRAYSNPGGFCGLISGDQTNFVGNFWDNTVNPSLQGIGNSADPEVISESTTNMQMESTFTDAGWDFATPIWKICEGTNYPKLAWQKTLPTDFVCPDGVEFNDLGVFVEQWLMEKLSADVVPADGDGIVDFADWAVFAKGWQNTIDINDVAVFADQWLRSGAYCADIAPPPGGDGVVDMFDFAVFAQSWLAGLE